VLNDVFAWCIVHLIAVGRFQFILPMYWTLQNLKDSENKQEILHCSSIFSAATVHILCVQADDMRVKQATRASGTEPDPVC
jgi:hypothetical protein